MREQPLGSAGGIGIGILILVLVSIFADSLAPHRYEGIHLRDLLSRLIHGARLSLTEGLAATALNVLVAVLIGGRYGAARK